MMSHLVAAGTAAVLCACRSPSPSTGKSPPAINERRSRRPRSPGSLAERAEDLGTCAGEAASP